LTAFDWYLSIRKTMKLKFCKYQHYCLIYIILDLMECQYKCYC